MSAEPVQGARGVPAAGGPLAPQSRPAPSAQYPGKPESYAATSPQRQPIPPVVAKADPFAASAEKKAEPASPARIEAPDRIETPAAEARQETEFREALVSPSTEKAVHGSIDRLKSSLLDNADAKVEAVLRPMLREWLDDNLPALVEKLVREEVDRIVRGK